MSALILPDHVRRERDAQKRAEAAEEQRRAEDAAHAATSALIDQIATAPATLITSEYRQSEHPARIARLLAEAAMRGINDVLAQAGDEAVLPPNAMLVALAHLAADIVHDAVGSGDLSPSLASTVLVGFCGDTVRLALTRAQLATAEGATEGALPTEGGAEASALMGPPGEA